MKISTLNLAASSLIKILRLDVLSDIETGWYLLEGVPQGNIIIYMH